MEKCKEASLMEAKTFSSTAIVSQNVYMVLTCYFSSK